MPRSDASSLSQELIALHEAPRLVPCFSERYADLTPEQGYRAAFDLHEYRLEQGWRKLGRKIGFTNRTIWHRYGVFEPMWGMVYDRTVIESVTGRATVSLAPLAQPRIEPEILFRLRAVPSPDAGANELLASIEWVAHSIEIVQCHHPEWKVAIADCTADNGLHGRLVTGQPVAVEELPDLVEALPSAAVSLYNGDRLIDQGVGANVLDSPLNALAFLVRVLDQQHDAPPLEAGEIISTGVLTDAHPVVAGQSWRTRFSGIALPGLEISFT